ncbi:MAG TPA: hypothetical protein QF525_01725, partial [Candidatus Thalassarchaeaceae archaeon]|nr:hypothetical protein [Candidatus Thalassarchaeaceae archaeon]
SKPSCARCGESKRLVTKSSHSNSTELFRAVSSANLPEEIRGEVEARLKKEKTKRNQNQRVGVEKIHGIMLDSTNSDGILTMDKLTQKLMEKGVENPTAEEILGMAEVQGVIIRSAPNSWLWL